MYQASNRVKQSVTMVELINVLNSDLAIMEARRKAEVAKLENATEKLKEMVTDKQVETDDELSHQASALETLYDTVRILESVALEVSPSMFTTILSMPTLRSIARPPWQSSSEGNSTMPGSA